jgi:hypothetical protein
MKVLVNKNGPNQQEGTALAQFALAAIEPLCDVCVQIGIFDVSMKREYLDAWEGVTWRCTAHHRVYHPFVGYQSREGNSLVHQCSEGCCVNIRAVRLEVEQNQLIAWGEEIILEIGRSKCP